MQFIEHTCLSAPESQAYQCLEKSHSYAEINQLSTHFAQWLQHESGLKPGDRIGDSATQYYSISGSGLRRPKSRFDPHRQHQPALHSKRNASSI